MKEIEQSFQNNVQYLIEAQKGQRKIIGLPRRIPGGKAYRYVPSRWRGDAEKSDTESLNNTSSTTGSRSLILNRKRYQNFQI